MEYNRGPRFQGPPPHQSFRQRGPGNYPPHTPHHHQQQPPVQVQTRFIHSVMNPVQWNTQAPVNTYPAQDESMNYAQPPYNADGFNNYPYPHPQAMAQPELINSPPQPFPYGQQMYAMPPMLMQHFPQQSPVVVPPVVTPPPVVQGAESVPPKKIQYNNSMSCCSKCGHKNFLAESEIHKKSEEIDALTKQVEVLSAQYQTLKAEHQRVLSQHEAQNSKQGDSQRLGELQVDVKEGAPDNEVKPAGEGKHLADEAKKPSSLSADAIEFSPKQSSEADVAITSPASAEVPVVSAKGVMDEDGDAPTPGPGSSEAETQVEEHLLENDSEVDVPEASDTSPEAVSLTQPQQYDDWNDEVEKTAADTPREPEIVEPVKTEVQSAEEWDDGPNVNDSANENWRSPTNSQPPTQGFRQDNFQQRNRKPTRGNRLSRGGSYGRGHNRFPNEQQNSEGFHNYPHNRFPVPNNPRFHHNRGYPRGNDDRNNQGYNRHVGRTERQDDETRRQGERQENNSRERYHNRDDRNMRQRDNNNSYSTVLSREPSRENMEAREMAESGRAGQGAWHRPKGNQHQNQGPRGSQNQNQGNFHSKNFQNAPNVEAQKAEIRDIVTEVQEDLFAAPGDVSLAHCVAEDFRMGMGIAVKFKKEFKRVPELLDQNVKVGGCAHLQDNDRYIFYLVTKEVSSGKPKFEDLKRSLEVMRAKCEMFKVKKLAMPRIGCGLDKLEWARVRAAINEVFQDSGIEVKVYNFNVEGVAEADGSKPEGVAKLSVIYKEMKLVDMERDTALIFFGTENGHMDPTAESLDSKHHFEVKYKNTKKNVGTVCCFENPKNYDWVFGLIIAKTVTDKVLFKDIESCCSQLSQMLRKHSFAYAGVEFLQGWNIEKIFFEKILCVFRESLTKHVQLWVCFPSAEMDHYRLIKDKDGKKEKPNAK